MLPLIASTTPKRTGTPSLAALIPYAREQACRGGRLRSRRIALTIRFQRRRMRTRKSRSSS